jgi:hypothetical protein
MTTITIGKSNGKEGKVILGNNRFVIKKELWIRYVRNQLVLLVSL